MKRIIIVTVLAISFIVSGCGLNETAVKKIANEEIVKAIEEYKKSFKPDKFGFGIAWEKDFSYAQGVKVGNIIFVAGQLAHGQKVDENGMPEFMMGDFEEQFRATLENIKAVLANYGATMDDIVFLQNFIDPEAGKKKAGNYLPIAAKLIREYFPKGLQTMTIADVANLFGEEQLVESNAIAVLSE